MIDIFLLVQLSFNVIANLWSIVHERNQRKLIQELNNENIRTLELVEMCNKTNQRLLDGLKAANALERDMAARIKELENR